MRRIVMDYDHYMGGSTFDDGEGRPCEWLEARQRENRELADWAGDFLRHLEEEYNEDIELVFTGIKQDCETMEDAVKEFNKGSGCRVQLVCKAKGATRTGGKVSLDDLRKLYEEVNSKDCPFGELRNNEGIKEAFRKGSDAEFEIAVVATMSSGKSTLINAMLGRELLPARNEATTATITRIHNKKDEKDEKSDSFSCEYQDKDGTERIIDPVSLEDMNRLNDDGIPDINIYGDIQGIDSQALNLVLTDTPGPNNSRTDDHKAHTYQLIKESKFKPMVLYVLNATQLAINDDNTLLKEISAAMRSGGRQASDRFIFVMNKADEFDPEKGESVERMMEKTKDYLSSHGIENPRLFPCSAYYAKLLRQAASGEELTRKEKVALPGMVSLFIEDEEMHFSSKATVSEEVRKNLERRLQAARDSGDDNAQALIHTGIPAVEEAINEYLDKYAIPAKIKEALSAFMDIIKDTEVEAKANSELADNTQKREEALEAIESVSKKLEQGDKAKGLKDEVDKLSVTKEVQAAYEQFAGEKFSKFSRGLADKYRSESAVRQDKADGLREEVNKAVEELQGQLAVDVENIINDKIGNKAQELVGDYNKYVKELMDEFKFAATPAALVGHLAHMRNLTTSLDSGAYEFEREEVVGTRVEKRTGTRIVHKTRTVERRVKKSGIGGFFKRLFGRDSGWEYESYEVPYDVEQTYEYDEEVNVTGKVKYVDFSRMVKDYVTSVLAKLDEEARKIAFEEAEEKAGELKQAFKDEFDKLNEAMKEKLAEKEKSLQDAEEREELIKQSQQNLAWINGFKKKLRDAIGS